MTAETLEDKTFTPWLSVALKAARLPGDSLIFQIREGDANNYMKQAKEFARTVHELHCKVSICQFGCALNPFNTLKHIDVDYVKIDGSFTEELQKKDDAKEEAIEAAAKIRGKGESESESQEEGAGAAKAAAEGGEKTESDDDDENTVSLAVMEQTLLPKILGKFDIIISGMSPSPKRARWSGRIPASR